MKVNDNIIKYKVKIKALEKIEKLKPREIKKTRKRDGLYIIKYKNIYPQLVRNCCGIKNSKNYFIRKYDDLMFYKLFSVIADNRKSKFKIMFNK